jgi:hypothetical protein
MTDEDKLTPAIVRLSGLDKLDARELQSALGDAVAFEEETLTADRAGEAATLIAVVALSALAIRTLAQWLMKQRRRGQTEFIFELERPDGTRERREFRFATESSSPPSPEVIKELGAALQLDAGEVTKALGADGG